MGKKQEVPSRKPLAEVAQIYRIYNQRLENFKSLTVSMLIDGVYLRFEPDKQHISVVLDIPPKKVVDFGSFRVILTVRVIVRTEAAVATVQKSSQLPG